jgi:hypothetical protein
LLRKRIKGPGVPGPLLFPSDGSGVTNMRNPDADLVAVAKTSPSRDGAAMVCLALVLALIALASRIASVW